MLSRLDSILNIRPDERRNVYLMLTGNLRARVKEVMELHGKLGG